MNKETIELVKKMVEDGNLPQEVAMKYCPELKENKDEEMRKELIRAFQSLNTLEIWNGIKRSDILAWLEKKGKQEWTEEDKPYFKKISLILSKELPADEFHDVMAWFEHLKSTDEGPDILKGATLDNNEDGLIADTIKAKSEQKIEWSVEDYNEIETIACHLDNIGNEGMARVLLNIRDKYYHINPQSHWKPSENEMEALEVAIEHCDKAHFVNTNPLLVALYEDLKKLIK